MNNTDYSQNGENFIRITNKIKHKFDKSIIWINVRFLKLVIDFF